MRQFAVTQPPSSPPTHQSPPSPARHASPRLLDTFRCLHPAEEGAYTCWSTLLDSRKTNYGTRIDYILSSLSLASDLTRAEVWQYVVGSDHCPVFAEFNLRFLHPGSQRLPSLCSCWFSGKQSKLSDFVTRRATTAKSEGVVGSAANEEGSSMVRKEVADTEPRGVSDRGVKRTKEVVKPPLSKRTLRQASLLSFSSAPQAPPPATPPHTDCASAPQARGELSASWKTVFGCGPKSPPCSGHKEPCVLRKVKKPGPNKDRQFWVCARPGGSKTDPQATCNFFKWAKEKRK